MKKLSLGIMVGCMSLLICCKQESNKTESANNADMQGKEAWAEVVESKTIFVKPDGWEDSYWESVNQKVELRKLFNTVGEAVLTGKVKAYDLLTDSLLTVEQVKQKITLDSVKTEADAYKVNADDISMIRMREKWVFDKENFRLQKQVSRIDLTTKHRDEAGEYVGDKALFYVYLN